MSAQKLDLTIYDNDTYTLELSVKDGTTVSNTVAQTLPPLVLTGYAALLQLRRPTGELLAELSTPGLAGHSGQGIVITDAANGAISVTFGPTFCTPALLALKIVDYDLILIDALGAPHRYMYGKLMALKGVSRVV